MLFPINITFDRWVLDGGMDGIDRAVPTKVICERFNAHLVATDMAHMQMTVRQFIAVLRRSRYAKLCGYTAMDKTRGKLWWLTGHR